MTDTPTHAVWQWLPQHRGGPCWELTGLYGSAEQARAAACLANARHPGELFAVMRVSSQYGPIEPPAPEALLSRVEADHRQAINAYLHRCLEAQP